MNSFLLFLAGLLALAMGTLFAAPYFVDWNDYRDVFEAQATKLIGRKVDVGGDVSLTLLPAPVLRFETINVADAKGSFDTPFAAARSFTVWLSVPPLLRGNIEARSVEIDQPVLNLRIAKDGSGNWAGIGGEAVDMPFIPKDVALNSVEINSATVNIWRGNPEPDSVIENLNGELSARSLSGPYKFTGNFQLEDKLRDLKFSTGRPEKNGEIRLKASVRSPEAKESFSIDGAVRGVSAIPVFKGVFNARLADDTASDEKKDADKKAESPAPFEIKSEIFAGLTGAQFNDVELVVTRNDKPQTVRGLLDIKFDKGLVVGGTFSSRWVDLDSWSGSSKAAPPKLNVALAGLANELLDRISVVREGSMRLFLDQAVLAGDLATNVQVSMSVADKKLELSRLSARLPGDNKIKLEGFLSKGEGGAIFKGPISVQGPSLSRLLRWAGVASEPSAATQPGDFLLNGELSTGPDLLSLEQGEGKLFGSAFKGAFTYRGGADGEISLTLNSDKMDLERVLGSSASAKSLWALLGAGGEKKQGDAAKAGASGTWLGNMRAAADVNIGAVSFSGLGESALEAKLTLNKGALDIRQLNLKAGSGVSIQAGGRLTGLGDKPQGNVTLALHADNGAGLVSLGEFLELPGIAKGSPQRLAAMTPVQVTAAIRSVDEGKTGLDIQLEGSLGKSDLQLKLGMDGVPAKWGESQISLQGSLTNDSGAQLLQQLRPHLKQNDLAAFSAGAGKVSLETSGVANTGLQTKMTLNAGGANWITQGTYRVADTGNSFSGTTNISTQNTAAGLALIGVRGAPGHGSEPASLEASIESTGYVARLSDVKGTLGGATFSGDGQIDMTGDRPVFAARVVADEVSLPRLFAPMVAWHRNQENSQIIRGVSQVGGYWPDAPFNASQLASADGAFSLETERLRLTGELVLNQAKMQAKLSQGSLKVSALEGGLFGGTFTASGELTTRGGGMAVDAQAKVSGLRLERMTVTSDGGVLVNAPTDITISLKGEGLTPRGLASGLSGAGKLELGAGKINGFSLGAAHAAASTAQREKSTSGVDEAELGRRVAENLKNSEMAFSPINAPFRVSNGVLEFDKLALSDSEGRVTVASYLQLATLELDSEWALQAAESTVGAKPRVSLIFTGALKDIGKLQPKIDTTGLARYVTIRKMQKDVERLEKLDVTGKKPEDKPKQPAIEKTAQAPKPRPPASATVPPGPVPPLPIRKLTVSRPQAPPAPAMAAVPQPVRKPPPAAVPPAPATAPSAPPVAAVIPKPEKKPSAPVAPPSPATAPPVEAVIPQQVQKAPPASAPPGPATAPPAVPPSPATTPPVAAVVPQAATAPPATAIAPQPVKKPSVAPLPRRKPRVPAVPRPAPRATAQPAPALPWQQNVTPPAPTSGAAPAPTPLPAPAALPDGQTTPDTPPAARRSAPRFDPFSDGPGN